MTDFNFCLNRIIELDEADSTQDIAKNLAEIYNEDCVLVQAAAQTNGRGRFDRAWEAPRGGLYISLLLRPKGNLVSTGDLSVKAGRAVAKTLKELYGIKTKIKLPNDVLALKNGIYKKISGILIETSAEREGLAWLVIGIGVNLNNKLSKKLEAASVAEIIKKQVNIKEFRNTLLKNFAKEYLSWNNTAD
jgi:BirA family biotin operon repressor/biotin-[acetyl-CoA-carboxylase] ligase